MNRQKLPAIALGCALLACFGSAVAAPHSLTWTKTNATVGSTIVIAGQQFIIARLPVRDVNGDKYAITLPVPSQSGQITFGIVTTVHSTDAFTGNTAIDGFPALVQVSDGRTYMIQPDFLDPGNNRLVVESTAQAIVQIKLGATIVSLFENFEGKDPQGTAPPETDVSMGTSVNGPTVATDTNQWWKWTDPVALTNALDKWIDYVRVWKF